MNKLGFGFLRLPVTEPDSGEIDLELTNQLVDRFLAAGRTYFDTAYTYLDGRSEWALRESLVKRHDRREYILADKLPGYKAKSHEDCWAFFREQQERCGVEYFDVYLLHWLNETNYRIAEQYDEFGFLQELKARGLAGRTGFSYHDSAALLDEILTRHPEVDYVQLQINYLDWESEAIQARACYETAMRHGKRVIVMEPVKGGTLAQLPKETEAMLAAQFPGESPAACAIRFAASLPGVEVVLSGMNTLEQLEDNLRDLPSLTAEEQRTLLAAADQIRSSITVACTGCGYCVSGCPKKICIPNYFRLYNEYVRNPKDDWKIRPVYDQLARDHGRAGDCVNCKNCERGCPQKLPVTRFLAEASVVFDR